MSEDPLTFIQPWLEGAKAVNFKKRVDRTDSLYALHALHETKTQIDWHASTYLHPYPLIAKWEDRIGRFRKLAERVRRISEKAVSTKYYIMQ